MLSYAGIIFDCDGTLIDSESIHQSVLDTVSRKHNLAYRDPHQHIGLSFQDLWPHVKGDSSLSFEAWVKDVEGCYTRYSWDAPLRPQMQSTLHKLSRHNIPLACASNAQKHYVNSTLMKGEIHHYFQSVLGREDVTNPKPHPEIYLNACKALKLCPSQCLAVEDSLTGIQSAKAAGLTVIAFPHAYTKNTDLSLADKVVEDIWEVIDITGIDNSIIENTSTLDFQFAILG